jgi:NADPH:quinone reductase-like Zn-dependent oxidoreductase
VFDALGFESWDESSSILSQNGTLVEYGGNLQSLNGGKPRSVLGLTMKLFARNALLWRGKTTKFYCITKDNNTFRPDLLALFALLGEGKINLPIWN